MTLLRPSEPSCSPDGWRAKSLVTCHWLSYLNLPPEMEILDLIDYVSQRLKIKILHDEQVANKKVSIKAPVEIPASSLLSVLESALKMKGLALVDADTPGWKKVITADIHTNTLIVVAEPPVQRAYAELIEQLDKRRPQVLIEARLVILDTSDDFGLGVEFSTGDRQGDRRLLSFSSFGLSEVDPTTGALAIIPGLGFNGTLVDPDVADAVLRAFTTHRRSRVMSAPRILVNDNAEGQLSSVAEVPFTSVNASNTVATTSFAGFAEAGTTITVTPRISDDDHLQLDFVITLNSFTGTGGAGVPPPRQTDEVRSQITIPDGHTVIVGGLNREGQSWDFDSMPFIEKVPLLRYLGGNETRSSNTSSMFIFLRPVILRDDKFRDLKYVSTQDAKCATICPDFPTSEPIWLP